MPDDNPCDVWGYGLRYKKRQTGIQRENEGGRGGVKVVVGDDAG